MILLEIALTFTTASLLLGYLIKYKMEEEELITAIAISGAIWVVITIAGCMVG